jgi:hypothetical protein
MAIQKLVKSLRWPAWSGRSRVIGAIVLLALALRAWAALKLPTDFDEPIYLQNGAAYATAVRAGRWGAIINYQGNSEHPPLGKLIYGLAVLACGDAGIPSCASLTSRLISAAFGTLAVLMLALIDPLAGFFLAVQTLVIKYTSQVYLEALPLFAMLLSVVALRRWRGGFDRWFWLSAFALGLTAAGKYSYFPILFVLLYLAMEKQMPAWRLLLYLGVAALSFWALDPVLWRDAPQRLSESLTFHTAYSQSAHVQQSGFPWYQPFLWISRSWPVTWHPDVFFFPTFDGLIFTLGGLGWLYMLYKGWRLEVADNLAEVWRARRWVLVWLITGMLTLLAWPTKWPQYTLVVLPALCLSAAYALRLGGRWFVDHVQ